MKFNFSGSSLFQHMQHIFKYIKRGTITIRNLGEKVKFAFQREICLSYKSTIEDI